MDMQEIPVTEARAQLSDLVSQVAFGGQPVVLTRHGKPLVALVPTALLAETDQDSDPSSHHDAPVVLDLTPQHSEHQESYTIAARHRGDD